MFDAGRRPMGRLFYWAIVVLIAASGAWNAASGAAAAGTPSTTQVVDKVVLADGTFAQGNLIITWPAFVTASGTAVAGGTTNATLGADGALSVALVSNAGATPAGVYYSVVFQLGPGEVRTEFWIVPTTSPATLAMVRMTPGAGLAAQPVSMQYVNSELATKADDSQVVHLNGTESIGGAKSFNVSPVVPAPTNAGDIANKSYVDQSVANVGAGNYLPTAGGTMSGPITLPGSPSAPLQAATKQYVDFGVSGKADLVAGLVPTNQLGSGAATAGSCLLGNGTWGACGSGGGGGNVSTTPATSQNVAQPVGTQFSTNNLANVRYLTSSWNWQQSPSDSLTIAGSNTIHLSPCPIGIDTSNNVNRPYFVYIAAQGTPGSRAGHGWHVHERTSDGNNHDHNEGCSRGGLLHRLLDFRGARCQEYRPPGQRTESTKARVQRLEQIANTNTEAREYEPRCNLARWPRDRTKLRR